MQITRRKFLIGGACLLAAPAIVRIGSLMPVRDVSSLWMGETGFWHAESQMVGGKWSIRMIQINGLDVTGAEMSETVEIFDSAVASKKPFKHVHSIKLTDNPEAKTVKWPESIEWADSTEPGLEPPDKTDIMEIKWEPYIASVA